MPPAQAVTLTGAPLRIARALALALALGTALGACSDILPEWMGAAGPAPLPGKRVGVLTSERQLAPDPQLDSLEVRLPRPRINADWPQTGGQANRAVQHLALADDLKTLWRTDVGTGTSSDRRLMAPPIVAGGRVFVMDAATRVSAIAGATGERQWNVDLTPEHEERGGFGGGLAFDRGRLYIATGYGEIVALDPANGAVNWRTRVGTPIRGAPVAEGNRVLAVTLDNQLHALNAETGRVEWTHAGLLENAAVLSATSPAIDSGTIVVPYSSGEIYALRASNGAVAWGDQLVKAGRLSSVASMNNIAGQPVIDRGRVYAASHSGRMVSIELRTGERVWERDIASLQSPWVAGDFVYVVTVDAEVVCLSRGDGRIRWVRPLARFRNPDSRSNKGPIAWYGPVLAGDRLVLLSSHGEAVSISPYTGDILGQIRLGNAAVVGPVVADGVLYILTDDAKLTALK